MSQILNDAKRRIKEVRQKDVDLLVLKDGKPVEGAVVSFRMQNHQFLFGSHCYMYSRYKTKEENDLFSELFVKMLNSTMMPFHWGEFEPRYREYNEPYISTLIDWAKKHNLKRKLHALIWHWVCPKWITYDSDIKERYTERISHLMSTYGDDFDFFDLANETTTNDEFENPVAKWVKEYGPMNMLKFGSKLVRSFKPDAQLIYNDWNVHKEVYYDFLQEMRDNDIDVDIIGVQSHQHVSVWSQEETMRVLERAAAFGWPLHFPECSFNSGIPDGEINFLEGGKKNKWIEREEDLYTQAENARDFYTLVFSHPAVELLNWFDFTDHYWLGAPAGLVTDNLKVKPVYNALYDLIRREWHSDVDTATGTSGLCQARLFCGNYDITVDVNGEKITVNQDILRERFYAGGGDPIRLEISL